MLILVDRCGKYGAGRSICWLIYRIGYSKLFDFFFRAEDGIRDAQESRGLGDVYKRQGVRGAVKVRRKLESMGKTNIRLVINRFDRKLFTPVSYTHLTLPTIYSV